MSRWLRWALLAVLAMAAAAMTTYVISLDAARTNTPAVPTAPVGDDEYASVTTWCDHGNRVYLSGKSMQGAGSALAVVAADLTCGGAP